MGIKDLFKKKTVKFPEDENTLYQPVAGTVIPQRSIADETFSSGMMGIGCGIEPDSGEVYSPVNGSVVFAAETKHAIGIKCENGIEILIHVGIDTVEMEGNGFEIFVKEGDKVQTGQHILTFNREAVLNAGYKDTVILLITTSDELKRIEVLRQGKGNAKEKLIKVEL